MRGLAKHCYTKRNQPFDDYHNGYHNSSRDGGSTSTRAFPHSWRTGGTYEAGAADRDAGDDYCLRGEAAASETGAWAYDAGGCAGDRMSRGQQEPALSPRDAGWLLHFDNIGNVGNRLECAGPYCKGDASRQLNKAFKTSLPLVLIVNCLDKRPTQNYIRIECDS
jgi:hypothetical protein